MQRQNVAQSRILGPRGCASPRDDACPGNQAPMRICLELSVDVSVELNFSASTTTFNLACVYPRELHAFQGCRCTRFGFSPRIAPLAPGQSKPPTVGCHLPLPALPAVAALQFHEARWCAVTGKRAKPRGLLTTAAGLSLAAGCVVVHRPCRSVPHLDGCALVLEVRARRGAPQSQRPESTTGSLLKIRRPLCSPGTAALTAALHDELQCKHTESALNFIQCEQPPVRTDRTRLIQATLRDRGVQALVCVQRSNNC